MLQIELSWQAAAVSSACLLGVTAAARLHGALAGGDARARQRAGPGKRFGLAEAVAIGQETGIVVGLFALWQLAGRYAARVPGDALARAQWIWHAERVAWLPNEAAVQRLFLPHPLLVQVCNLYYASLHFVVLIALLVWVFLWHRERYPEVRAILVMLTAACLLVQLIPVAPPRMLPSDGMVDTGVLYGQSVYGSIAGFNPDELSAMPSVHVAWALLIGITVVRCSRSRWRWLALGYPAATTLGTLLPPGAGPAPCLGRYPAAPGCLTGSGGAALPRRGGDAGLAGSTSAALAIVAAALACSSSGQVSAARAGCGSVSESAAASHSGRRITAMSIIASSTTKNATTAAALSLASTGLMRPHPALPGSRSPAKTAD